MEDDANLEQRTLIELDALQRKLVVLGTEIRDADLLLAEMEANQRELRRLRDRASERIRIAISDIQAAKSKLNAIGSSKEGAS